MATATRNKTNERPGTRAQVKYVRGSASKARRVLDLIRNESTGNAIEILTFSDQGVAETILKVLNSAIANAEHNDSIPGDELYVAACYADEGPTLKRFRPRARGRASRINKRTCHITIIVARYEDEELEKLRERQASQVGTSAASAEARRRRVAKSQEADEGDESAEAVEAPADEATEVDPIAASIAAATAAIDAAAGDDVVEDAAEDAAGNDAASEEE